MLNRTIPTVAAIILCIMAVPALAAPPHFEGFENPAFTPGGDNWNNYLGGDIERVATGTDGIASMNGVGHAIVTNLVVGSDVFSNPSLGAYGPYTRLDGYSSDFDGGFVVTQGVYLDTAWTQGQGFDLSTAISNQGGTHQRDYVFHVGVDGGDLIVNASNNTDFNFNAFKLANENGGDNFVVTSTGWYSLQSTFYGDGGNVAVDMALLDAGGNELWSITRNGTDPVATSGGNRYAWLTYNNIDRLAIDNTQLVPEPASLALLGLGGLALMRRRAQ